MDESFYEDGEKFPQFIDIIRGNAGNQRNSMHERTKSQDYTMIDAAIPKYTRLKTSSIIFEEYPDSPV
jgi:hypothetical protein